MISLLDPPKIGVDPQLLFTKKKFFFDEEKKTFLHQSTCHHFYLIIFLRRILFLFLFVKYAKVPMKYKEKRRF